MPVPPLRRLRRAGLTLLTTTTLIASALAAPAMASASAQAPADVTDGLILSYPLTQTSGTVVTDVSGNGKNGALVGTGTWTGAGGLSLDGSTASVKLPNNLLTGLASVTVSTEVLIRPAQTGAYFIWGMGNTATSSAGTGYLFMSGDAFRAGITTTNWSGEKVTSKGSNLARGVWKSVTYTQTGTTGTLYEDGVQVGQNTAVSVLPSALTSTTNNNIGRSNYAADALLNGKVRNFRVYDRALTGAEVADIALNPTTRVAADKATLSLGDTSAVAANLALPATAENGSTLSWATSDPAVITAAGVITRGSNDATATLTATLTNGAVTDTRTFQVKVLAALSAQARADAAAAALSVPNLADARGYLTLPSAGLYESSVTWSSADAATVTAGGVVHRPAFGQTAKSVALTATVTVGTATATRVLTATVPALPKPEALAGYAFSYFTGDSLAGEKIYFAASKGNNALQWAQVNGGQPVLTSTLGTKGLRDPFLIRSPEGDKFYLLATDLSIGGGTSWGNAQDNGSKYLEVWESTDLVTWSAQRHVKVAPDAAGDAWAPEAYWSDEAGAYVVYWASNMTIGGKRYHRIYTANTRDFITFTPPVVWQDPGTSVIDSTVLKDNGTYYRFTKDEGSATGCSDIIQEKSTDLLAVDDISDPSYDKNNRKWKQVSSCIGKNAGTSAVEGPTAIKTNDGDTSGSKYYLFVDEYGGRGYIPLGTNSLDAPTWKVPASYSLPANPRHGTILPVTATELRRLVNAPDPVKATAEGLVLRYPLDATSGTVAADASGNGYNGTLSGDATLSGGALNLGGTNGYVKLPNNIMAGLDAITVSTDVWIDSTQATPYFIWGLGNTDTSGAGNGYLFTTGNNYRTSLTTGSYTAEQTVTNSAALGRGVWKNLTYTLAGGTATLYLDGIKVGEKTGVTAVPGDIGGGTTTANYIGRSMFTSDKYLKGKVRDFRLYNRALSAAEIGALGNNATALTSVTLDSLKVPAIINSDTNTVLLPVKAGTDVKTLAPVFAVSPGSSVNESGAQDYTSPRTVTVTTSTGATRVWTVTATVMKSPILPGFYADPNIAVFGDTFYIYATTDGTAGWGGKDFYSWKSKDLVTWERSAQPFLTLDGANGTVPWATGNAWAPTIIERGGKYYFYFSGHNAALNRKTIGVAVADSPEGPFVAQPQAMILNNEAVTTGQAIDPATFHDPVSGKYFLFWGNGSPVYAELADDMISLKPGTIKAQSGLTSYREGSFINYRDGIYHMTYSIDDTGSENYRVGYATSSSVDGPWTYRGVILEKDVSQGILGTGHSSIVQVPGTDDWYIVYHRFGIPGGDGTHRETTIDHLYFNADGTIKKVVPTLTSVEPLVRPDTTAPVATVSLAPNAPTGDNDWYNVPVAVTAGATDDRDANPVVKISIDGAAAVTYTGPVTVSTQGTHQISVTATDAAGNTSTPATKSFKVDTVRPVTVGSLTGTGTVTVTLAATDATSGVASTEYKIDNGNWTSYGAPFTVTSGTSDKTVTFRSTDRAGNAETTQELTVPKIGVVATKTTIEVADTTVSTKDDLVVTAKVTSTVPFAGTVTLYDGATAIATNPLYVPDGTSGDNPLFQGMVTFRDHATGMATGRRQFTVAFTPDGTTVSASTSAAAAVEIYFFDTPPGSSFYDEILWLSGSGITTGVTGGGFDPIGLVSRQAMAAFLYRMTHPGQAAPTCAAAPFADVPVSNQFCGEISWLKTQNITTGYAGNKFQPGASIDRQAMAAFLYRLRHPGVTTGPTCTSAPFADVPVGSQFCGEISWLKTQNITTGYAGNKFQPGEKISRQAMAAFLYRLQGVAGH
ncbi:hydrolase [Nakamurella silvestris]|nr:hydrolase [Nakamurella silvestris]